MRKLHIITILFFLSTLPSLVHAEWKKVSENVSGTEFYLDYESIRKHSGYIYVWRLDNHLKPNKNGVLSEKLYSEIDCKRFRLKYLSGSFHSMPMGEGPALNITMSNLNEWIYFPPDSVGEDILEMVCN